MKQHVFAFLVALVVWMAGNFIAGAIAQQQGNGTSQNPAISPVASTTQVTENARCVGGWCSAWVTYTCNGHLPDCNGGCWITGEFPCSACIQEPGATCVQQQITFNAKLYRRPCTSNNGYDCNTCDWSRRYYFGPYNVTTWVCLQGAGGGGV